MATKQLSNVDVRWARFWRSKGVTWREIGILLAKRKGRLVAYRHDHVAKTVAKAT